MYLFLSFVGFLLGLLPGYVELSCYNPPSDICNGEILAIPSMESRDPSVKITSATSNWTFCDVYAIDTKQWYKSGSQMSTNCPSMYSCGTKFPIWLSGTNPSPEDGLVNRTSCLKDFDSCCLISYKLTALNCGGFMAYCFVDLPSGCHQRYCFDYTPTSTTPQTPRSTDLNTGKSPRTTDAKQSTSSLSTEENQAPTPGKTSPAKSKDAKLLTIALAVIGLMTATIFGLLMVMIRRNRKSKVSDEIGEDKDYDTLKPPPVSVIDGKDYEHIYRTISFGNPVQEKHGIEHLRESHVYSIPSDPYSQISDGDFKTLAYTDKGLYDK